MWEKIKCPYCAELIDSLVEKCPYCAERIFITDLEKSSIEEENLSLELENNIVPINENEKVELWKKIITHMEFLWYKKNSYDDNLSDDWRIRISFLHDKNPNIWINIFKNNLIIITSTYTLWKHFDNNKSNIFYKKINEINSQTYISRWYKIDDKDGEDSINIEFTTNWYIKNNFVNDLNLMIEEINLHLPKISDLLD